MRILKKLFGIIITLAILGGIPAAGYYGWKTYKEKASKDIQVRFTSTKIGDLRVILKETATLQPKKVVEVKSKVTGRIIKLNFEAGDVIASGSVIAELDRYQYERTLDQKKRDYELARQQLSGLMPFGKVVENPEDIDPTTTAILVDRTLIEYSAAKVDYESKIQMFDRALISEKALDDARKQYQRTYVGYHDQIRTASLTLQTAREGYEQAVEDLAETTIRAPVDGVITKLPVEEGELVQGAAGMTQGTTLAEVADLEQMQAVVKLNEVDIGKIKIGDPVVLTLDSTEKREFKGNVETIAPSGTNTNNIVVFDVEIALHDKSILFKPEMTANADILVGQATEVVKIPLEAIKEVKGVKKVTLLTPKPGVPAEPEPTPQALDLGEKSWANVDFYQTEFAPQSKFEEKEVEVKTGLTNEIWAEIREGISGEITIKLPELSVPERREEHGFF